MNTPTHREQFDKITSAYIRGEILPWNPCACFIGNLLNNAADWIDGRIRLGLKGSFELSKSGMQNAIRCVIDNANGYYSLGEIYSMESNFMNYIEDNMNLPYEEVLFNAMTSTLEMLKQIHISKGENVDEIVLTKRELAS